MKKSKTWFLFISLILLLVFRILATRPHYKSGDNLRITTTVYSDPIDYEFSQYVNIANLSVNLPKSPEVSYGDRVVVEGRVNGGKLEDAKVVGVLENKNPASRLRNNIISFYQDTLPEPMAGLLSGIVLGSKGALTQDFWQATKKTGVAHVVVASGTNVTFVISFLTAFLFSMVPRRKAIPIVILAIILYLFISGFQAPLIRAAIMASIVFIAQETGRLVRVWRVFFLTVLLMLLYKPDWILDIGFALSFAATASLILFQKKIEVKLKTIPKIIKTDLSTTLAAQIGVAPILFFTFGYFNILSPLVNVLILWTIPPLMILGALGGVLGVMIPLFGKIVLYIAYPFLLWFVSIVSLFNY